MTWATQIGFITSLFLAINILGCKGPAWNLGGKLFWDLTVKSAAIKKTILIKKVAEKLHFASNNLFHNLFNVNWLSKIDIFYSLYMNERIYDFRFI